MSNSNGYGFVAGFFVGTTLGAALALLVAPKSGVQLRQDFVEEGKKLRDTTSGNISELREKGEELCGKAMETIFETSEGVKRAARTLTQGPKEEIDEPC